MTVRFKSPREAAFDANGNPRSGAKLYFYEPTTTTPKDVYSDAGLTTPILQPVTASSAGLWATIYMDPSLYRVICKDSAGTTIYDEDNYDPGLAAGFGSTSTVGVAQGGTGATNAAAALSNLGAASSATVTSIQDTVTSLDTKVDSGLNVSDPTRFGLLAPEDTVTRDLLDAGFGLICIQRVLHQTVVDSTITTTTPALDTSKPQITEGDQVFTKSFTPLSGSSTIRVRSRLTGDQASNNAIITMGLFKDSGADAVAADAFSADSLGPADGVLEYEIASGSTVARTYSLRAGVSAGTFNVNGGTGTLGGIRKSYLLIEEWVTI